MGIRCCVGVCTPRVTANKQKMAASEMFSDSLSKDEHIAVCAGVWTGFSVLLL